MYMLNNRQLRFHKTRKCKFNIFSLNMLSFFPATVKTWSLRKFIDIILRVLERESEYRGACRGNVDTFNFNEINFFVSRQAHSG